MKNYSKQREEIARVLKADRTHPSAIKIYEEVRKTLPNISLGTVYRNLADLEENGKILSLSVGDGTDRFDGFTEPHIHLICRKCFSVTDVPIESDFGKLLATENGFSPDSCVYTVYGICKNCSRK